MSCASEAPQLEGLDHEVVVPREGLSDGAAREAEPEAEREAAARAEGELAGAAAAPRAPEVYEEWWFWTIIGAVAVAGGGIAIAAAGRPAPTQTIIDVVLPSGA